MKSDSMNAWLQLGETSTLSVAPTKGLIITNMFLAHAHTQSFSISLRRNITTVNERNEMKAKQIPPIAVDKKKKDNIPSANDIPPSRCQTPDETATQQICAC